MTQALYAHMNKKKKKKELACPSEESRLDDTILRGIFTRKIQKGLTVLFLTS
jgi:hypothetical protein